MSHPLKSKRKAKGEGDAKPKRAPRSTKPGQVKPPRPPKEPELHHFPDETTHRFVPTATLVKYYKFVELYLETGDALAASRDAGFVGSSRSAQAAIVGGLLNNSVVARILTEQYEAVKAKTGATVEKVWQEYSRIAFVDPGRAYDENGEPLPPSQMDEDVRRAVSGYKVVKKVFGEDGESVEKELKFGGKMEALSQLTRLHRLLDNDKLVVLNGEEFIQSMMEGRQRAAGRKP